MLWSCPWSSRLIDLLQSRAREFSHRSYGVTLTLRNGPKKGQLLIILLWYKPGDSSITALLLCCDLAQVNLDLQLLCFCAVVLPSLSGDYWLTTLYFLVLFCFHLGQEALYWQTRLVMCNKVYGCLCVSSYLTMPCNKIVLQRLWNDHIDTDTLQIYSSDMTYSYYKVHE